MSHNVLRAYDLIQFIRCQTVKVYLRVSRECVVETKMRVICFTHNTDAGSSEILPGMTPNFKHICKLVVNCLKLWVVTRCKFMTMTKSRLECASQDACVLWELCRGLGHLIVCIQASKTQHAKLDICIEPFVVTGQFWFILFHIVSMGCLFSGLEWRNVLWN